MQELVISDDDRILVVAPHPDDECCGPGGVLLLYSNQCDVLVLTDGRQGQGDIIPDELKKIRQRELSDEMDFLGINNYRILEIEDGTLLSHTDCMLDISLKVYSKVFVTGCHDAHPDHKAACISLRNAILRQNLSSRIECYAYEVHTPLQDPTHFLDITSLLEKKLNLIRYHKSQLQELPYDLLAKQCSSYRATLYRMPGKMIEVYEKMVFEEGNRTFLSESEVLLQKERVSGWLLKRWVAKLQNNGHISSFLKKRNITEVYIYGYGDLGKLLLRELVADDISIRAVIDRRANQFANENIRVIPPEEMEEGISVILTILSDQAKVMNILLKKGSGKIYSLKSILERTGETNDN